MSSVNPENVIGLVIPLYPPTLKQQKLKNQRKYTPKTNNVVLEATGLSLWQATMLQEQ
jgi:hypothetical protein